MNKYPYFPLTSILKIEKQKKYLQNQEKYRINRIANRLEFNESWILAEEKILKNQNIAQGIRYDFSAIML